MYTIFGAHISLSGKVNTIYTIYGIIKPALATHDQDESDANPGREVHLSLNQSVSDSLTGDPANILTPASYLNLNTSAAMASVLECMTLQQSTYHIPQFDGKNPPLKDFLQDVANGAVFVTDATELKQSETVSDYNDRVQGLLNGARYAIEEKYTGTYGHTKESIIMMKPVVDCALDAFIRGLPR